MTTYTIIEQQRQQLLDLLERASEAGYSIECEPSVSMLQSLTPNSGERSPITELQEWWDSGKEQYHELEAKDGLTVLVRDVVFAERDAMAKDAAKYNTLKNAGYMTPDEFDKQVSEAMKGTP